MARIGIIVPYNELYYEAKTVALESEDIEVKIGLLSGAIDIARELIKNGVEIIISRGGTCNYLKKEFKTMPIIEMQISSYDTAEAILTAKRYNRDIALVIFKNMLYEKRDLSALFDCNIKIYYIEKEEEAEEAVIRAVKDGYGILLGGRIIDKIAAQMGIPCILITSGRESIYGAVREARQILKAKDESIKELNLIREVIENTSIGIIAANSLNRIKIANKTALKMLNKKREQVIGKKLEDLFPNQIIDKDIRFVTEIESSNLMIDKKENHIESIDIASIVTLEELSNIDEKGKNIRNSYINKGNKAKYSFSDIIGRSESINDVISIAKRYALVNSTILIEGETGTGKEIISQSIHNYSSRKNESFVAINCAALTESLLESELFGYVGGAFTGASKNGKPGLFEMADGGTILLDEIGEIPPTTQAKLLRVIQEREVMRIGDDRVIPVDVRIIAATNKNLQQLVEKNKFRSDLYYRLSVLKLKIPPLRERNGDIPILLDEFLNYFSNSLRIDKPMIYDECYEVLSKYKWPGNIRELRNFAERLITAFDEKIIQCEMIYKMLDIEDKTAIENIDAKRILKVLESNSYNKTKTAKDLGVSRTTLWKMLKENNIM